MTNERKDALLGAKHEHGYPIHSMPEQPKSQTVQNGFAGCAVKLQSALKSVRISLFVENGVQFIIRISSAVDSGHDPGRESFQVFLLSIRFRFRIIWQEL